MTAGDGKREGGGSGTFKMPLANIETPKSSQTVYHLFPFILSLSAISSISFGKASATKSVKKKVSEKKNDEELKIKKM